MAKGKKKSKKVGASRPRKATKDQLIDLGLLVVGVLAGDFIASKAGQMAAEQFPTVDPKNLNWGLGALEFGGGLYFAIGQTNPFFKGALIGLAVSGAKKIETNLGLLNGIGMGSFPALRGVETYRPLNTIGNAGVTPDGFRTPATVGKTPNMSAIYAAGGMMG